MLDVHPEARKGLAGGSLRLGDLIFVVRKNQVDAPSMNIDRRIAKQTERHGRALDVPPRSSRAHTEIPCGLVRRRRFPQHEVPRIVFGVLIAIDPSTRSDPVVVKRRFENAISAPRYSSTFFGGGRLEPVSGT